jgi:DNA-binding NarL/FixJ family response regulator
MSEVEWKDIRHELSLSPRQGQIVEMIALGKHDKEIARRMRLRMPTLRTYITRIFLKTGTEDRTQLVIHVFKARDRIRERKLGRSQS